MPSAYLFSPAVPWPGSLIHVQRNLGEIFSNLTILHWSETGIEIHLAVQLNPSGHMLFDKAHITCIRNNTEKSCLADHNVVYEWLFV